MKEFDLAIIGAGPAGLTAAIYAQRANLNCCLIEKNAPGGKIITTALIENYPGFKSITGPDLAFEMYDQATKLGAAFIGAKALKINMEQQYKIITLSNNEQVKAKAVIIATGMENRKLNIPGEDKYFGHGVSYCAICDGMFFKDKPIAVVGSGNSACEEALYLSKIGSLIYLVIRGDKMKAEQHVIDKILSEPKIKVIYNSQGVEIKGDKSVNEFVIKNKNDEITSLNVNAVFPFVGLVVNPIDDNETKTKKTENNFYLVDINQQTTCQGIFAAGDIVEKKYRQISTAISDGTVAALSAKEYIQKNF